MASRSQPTKRKNKPKSKSGSPCAICLKPIIDHSDTHDGEDSILCEGDCQKWIHRACAGLTEAAFDVLHRSGQPFKCYQCQLSSHAVEIATLHSLVDSLSKELTEVKSQLSVVNDQPLPSDSYVARSINIASQPSSPIPAASVQPPQNPQAASPINNSNGHPNIQSSHQDRKFNLVMYGIPESPSGTLRSHRVESDEQSATRAIRKIVPTFTHLSIRA